MRLGRTSRLTAAAAIAAFCAGATFVLAGGLLPGNQRSTPDEEWREIAWPFPRDAWPAGRAFRCQSRLCDIGTGVYLRMKIGLCSNCETGVKEDAEVGRVTDLDLISERFAPLATGEQVHLGAYRVACDPICSGWPTARSAQLRDLPYHVSATS